MHFWSSRCELVHLERTRNAFPVVGDIAQLREDLAFSIFDADFTTHVEASGTCRVALDVPKRVPKFPR
jgi:hypothetical protein